MKTCSKTDEIVPILSNKKINEKYYKLVFGSAALSRRVEPGQFLHVQINPGQDPFLRRPFSYYRIVNNKIELLYEILGRGTALLAAKKAGDLLRVMGPLGKPFTPKIKTKKKILIAGGVGVPPLVFLAEKYAADYLLIGTKSKQEVLPKKELGNVRAEILYSTNDGSYGVKGYVTVLLEKLLKQYPAEKLFIQTCGPVVMMKAVIEIAWREGIEGEASWDESMACGVGACLGCMVKTSRGWTPSCTEGPVFRFSELA